MKSKNNIAFIDGQNLHLGTIQNGWKISLRKFRIYLKDKYKVSEAYYFLGFINESYQDLYSNLQKAGFIIIFKQHGSSLLAEKKGNVDTDVVFEIMKNLVDNKELDKIILVSGDGDYIKVINYLIFKNKFEKILFPNRRFASSLYKKLGAEFYDYIENIKSYIEYKEKDKKEKGS
jgi:uncharacterized LabA/DUF88 family protein